MYDSICPVRQLRRVCKLDRRNLNEASKDPASADSTHTVGTEGPRRPPDAAAKRAERERRRDRQRRQRVERRAEAELGRLGQLGLRLGVVEAVQRAKVGPQTREVFADARRREAARLRRLDGFDGSRRGQRRPCDARGCFGRAQHRRTKSTQQD